MSLAEVIEEELTANYAGDAVIHRRLILRSLQPSHAHTKLSLGVLRMSG
jgi:hypothetical protein